MSKHYFLPCDTYLDKLFMHRHQFRTIFNEVLGLYAIHHISINFINQNQLVTYSSTPALEYNLFSQSLWKFDKTYHANGLVLEKPYHWHELYEKSHFEELIWLKQKRYNYQTGFSYLEKFNSELIIYSFASFNEPDIANEYVNDMNKLKQIGNYCTQALLPYYQRYLE